MVIEFEDTNTCSSYVLRIFVISWFYTKAPNIVFEASLVDSAV